MNGNGGNSGSGSLTGHIVLTGTVLGPEPMRSNFPGGVFAYGCPPIDTPPTVPVVMPLSQPTFDLSKYKPENFMLCVCAKCNHHVRVNEPCPFCVRNDLDALKAALGDRAQPAETIANLKIALRKALGALRDISRVTGGALETIIGECEKALDTP